MAATDLTDPTWDTAEVTISIDGVQPQLYASGDVFTASYDNDNVTIVSDIKGHGITVVNHNGAATVTINISALDPYYQEVLKDHNPETEHVINIMTPVGHLHTDSAHLVKLGDINSGSDAPTRPLQYKMPNLVATPMAA